jgi:hypothetical protein
MHPNTIAQIRKIVERQAKERTQLAAKLSGKLSKKVVQPLPKPIVEILKKRKNKPIRIVFLCEAGMQNSAWTKEQFISYLKKIGLDHNRVFSLGFDSMTLDRSKYNLRQTDYFVETLPNLLEHLPRTNPKLAFALKKSGVQVIGTDKLASVSQSGELEYPELVKEIISREQAKK